MPRRSTAALRSIGSQPTERACLSQIVAIVACCKTLAFARRLRDGDRRAAARERQADDRAAATRIGCVAARTPPRDGRGHRNAYPCPPSADRPIDRVPEPGGARGARLRDAYAF